MAVTLEIDNYVPQFGGAAINLVLELKAQRWQEDVSSKAQVMPIGAFQSIVISTNVIQMVINVSGTVYGAHPAHPLTADIAHIADAIDLEEAAVLWNRDTPKTRARLKLPLISGVRSYEGVISRIAIINSPGSVKQNFNLIFTVAWTPTTPALREWN